MGVIGILGMVLGLQVKASWQPKTNLLPPAFVKTAQFLLAHGIADPRGCEFRNAKYDFYVPSEWLTLNGHQVGWVRSGEQLVITPHGVAVKAQSIGSQTLTSRLLPRQQRGLDGEISSYMFLDDDNILALVLMAIHGEEALVAKTLKLISVTARYQYDRVSVRALAGYKYALYSGALNAYAKGEDQKAAAFCHQALDDLPEFEAFANELNTSSPGESQSFPFSFFQENLTVQKSLLGQSQRTVKIQRLLDIANRPIDDQVSILIEQLAEIGNPKLPELNNWQMSVDTVKGRLIEIGRPAVPKLLIAFDTDRRVSRSQSMFRSGPSKQLPHFITVKSIVGDILRTLAFNNGIQMSDDQLRQYWQTNLDKSDFQRIYDTLLDDLAPQRWKYAALALLQSDQKSNPYLRYQISTSLEPQRIWVRPEMKASFASASPSISDLLYKRQNTLPIKVRSFGPELNEVEDKLTLSLISYYVEPAKSLPALQMASTQYLANLTPKATQEYGFTQAHFGPVIEARKALGDQTYLADLEKYAAVLRVNAPYYSLEAGKYFIDRANDPAVAKIASSVFFDANSEYSVQKLAKSKPLLLSVIGSNLLVLPRGRMEAQRLLDDTTTMDPKTVESSIDHRMVFNDDGQFLRDEPIRKYGAIRICDLTAYALNRVNGCPEFKLDWPIERRNQVLGKVKAFVSNLGSQKLAFKDQYWLYAIRL